MQEPTNNFNDHSHINLQKYQYSILALTWYIYALDLMEILKTQKLTEEFAVHYILNKDYQLTKEEERITLADVLKWQPHLNFNKLLSLMQEAQDKPKVINIMHDFEWFSQTFK